MITYGFFNAVDGDRVYNADTFNTFFEGLISANGIFEGVDGGFAVSASGGLTLNVESGKAIVNNHWVRSDAIESVTIEAAHTSFTRYDMVVLRWNATDRTISLAVTTGTPASSPVKPTPAQNKLSTYEIALAYIKVAANATEITNANITDCRYDTEICGVITGLIKQVNTTTLYRQYAAQFEELKQELITWQTEQKTAFNNWFTALEETLQLPATYLKRNVANYITTREDGTQYVDVPASLEYEENDVLDVFVNGVLLVEGLDYELMMNEVENVPMIFIYSDVEINNVITFYCMKSMIESVVEEVNTILADQKTLIGG